MKTTYNTIKNFLLVFIISAFFTNTAFAQNESDNKKETKKAAIENLIKNKNFKFVVQTVIPQRGRTTQVNYDYDLKVSDDTLQSYLPYFGRAFVAPINPTQGALDFTSTDFEYQLEEKKKGGWDITIKPNDHNGERFYLSVADNGYATLQVTSNNRTPISFYGYVKERKG